MNGNMNLVCHKKIQKKEKMSSILNKLSILERLPVYQRMTARDNAGKKSKKTKKKHYEEHFNKNWDADLWE